MSKILETISKLDAYVLKDEKEEITIEKISMISSKQDIIVKLSNLCDKSINMFNVDNNYVMGYLYFGSKDYSTVNNELFDKCNDDCESNRISLICIEYLDKEELILDVIWNSLFYELDDEHYIMLFYGEIV